MPRYDEFYDRPDASDNYRRWHSYRRLVPYGPRVVYDDALYDDDFGERRPMGAVSEERWRMGMRDFSERYGRYSGGSPYSYEYSERTILNRPRYPGPSGFSRPLGREWAYRDERSRGRRYPPGRARKRWYRRRERY